MKSRQARRTLADGDEVAFFPPVTGVNMAIRVQAAAFDPGAEVNALHAANLGVGAVVSFVGYVRDFNDGRRGGDVPGALSGHDRESPGQNY